MERYSMLMDRKTQYVKTSDLLDFQGNPNQNPSKLFCDINKLILKFIRRGKRTRTDNNEGKEQS